MARSKRKAREERAVRAATRNAVAAEARKINRVARLVDPGPLERLVKKRKAPPVGGARTGPKRTKSVAQKIQAPVLSRGVRPSRSMAVGRNKFEPAKLSPAKRPRENCKKRPDSKKARAGKGGSKRFVPWCT